MGGSNRRTTSANCHSQKLSGERLARKRELDRQAQRIARQKTKNLIAHLESRIETLTQFNSSGNAKQLLDQLEEQRKANEALRSTLHTIQKVVNGGVTEMNSTAPHGDDMIISGGSPASTDNANVGQQIYEQSHSENTEATVQSDAVGASQAPQPGQIFPSDHLGAFENMNTRGTFIQPRQGLFLNDQTGEWFSGNTYLDIPLENSFFNQPRLESPQTHCACSKSLLFTNDVLERCAQMRPRLAANQKTRDADIPIRAILHGWNVVTNLYNLDPVWSILRAVDDALWSSCGATERLAIMWVVSLMLRYRSDPSDSNLNTLPHFMRERPSQRHIQHKPLIDFLVWPGLRERLVFNPHKYCSERFYSLFWACFRFTWPHKFADVYVHDRETGFYKLSDSFTKNLLDLQCWRMSPKFLQEFPELEADVPCAKASSDISSSLSSSLSSSPSSSLPADYNFYSVNGGGPDVGSGGLDLGDVSHMAPFTPTFMAGFPSVDWTSKDVFV